MNHIPEPVSCEALLAEALETLSKVPGLAVGGNAALVSWWHERGYPTIKLIEAFLAPDSVTPST